MSTCLICDHRDAHHRYACHACIADLRRKLRELLDYEDILTASTAPAATGITDRGAPGHASQPPINVDVVVMLDRRSRPVMLGPDCEPQPPWSIRHQLHHVAAWLRAEFDDTSPRTQRAATDWAYVLTSLDRCAGDEWITDLAGIIDGLWRQARARAHDQPPPQVGECRTPGCGGRVYRATVRDAEDGSSCEGVRCGQCRRGYVGLELVELAVEAS
ncbi:hypothetical protein [Actinocrispum wychmicini]|uniref:Uncharacterized protein n=1 Tax=Actinocrispum wychmicini TaxID=1213861 RepID=A0A4R2JF19_9PSEU|nr:hypothetical protein [Actinocrispum wychmicini]TCO57157.1 hypothetical protein EV192_106634 [Actinocrispum wychmicini]